MKSRVRKSIEKLSPAQLAEYENWIEEGKPKKFAVYLLHDPSPGVQVKKIGCSTKLWGRVFGGLNYKYFYNFNLLDIKYFSTKKEMLDYEKKIHKFYVHAKTIVNTFAYNKRYDLDHMPSPTNIKPRMANGGSENFKEESLPNSFNEIEKEMNC